MPARNLGARPLCARSLSRWPRPSPLRGCGMPGAPQPPSLDLPVRVAISPLCAPATRWRSPGAMPKRDTDKVPLKGNVTVRICRNESAAPDAPQPRTLASLAANRRRVHRHSAAMLSPRAHRVCSPILSSWTIARGGQPGCQMARRFSPAKRLPQSMAWQPRCAATESCCAGMPAPPGAAPVAVRLVRQARFAASDACAVKIRRGPARFAPRTAGATLLVEPGPLQSIEARSRQQHPVWRDL